MFRLFSDYTLIKRKKLEQNLQLLIKSKLTSLLRKTLPYNIYLLLNGQINLFTLLINFIIMLYFIMYLTAP